MRERSTPAASERSWPWLPLYGFLTFLLLSPMSFELDRRLPDDSDALQNLWIVWWGATHLDRGYPGIFEANAYYPNPLPLAYSEPQFAQALLSWPLFHWLENRVLSYNLLVAVSLSLSAFAAHLFLRELVGSSFAAFVGAVVYAFSAYSFSQLARSQLVSLQWMPLALLCLHRFFAQSRKIHLVGFVIFSVLLGLACFYYLQFYLVALAFIVPGCFWAYRSWQRPKAVLWFLASLITIAVPLSLVALPYFKLFRRYGFTGHADSYDLIHFFEPPAGSLLYRAFDLKPSSLDQFLGYIALALAGLGLWNLWHERSRSQRIVALAYLVLGVASFLLAAGPDIIINGERFLPGPYRLLQLVKPFGNLRDPHRFSILTRLALSLFVAGGAARLVAGGRRRGALVASLLSGLILGEQWTPRHTSGTEIPVGDAIPEAYHVLAAQPMKGPVAELPVLPFRHIRFNTLESYFSTFHQRPILVGKPSFPPPAFELLRWELGGFPDRKSIVVLQSLGVEQVLVHPKRWGDRKAHYLRVLARRSELPLQERFSDRPDVLWERYELGAEQLHNLVPLAERGTSRTCDCREIDRSSLRVDASGKGDPSLAIDGSALTRWTTGGDQPEGSFFEIIFDRPRVPVRVEIEMAFPHDEFARNLEVNGFRGQRFWRLNQIEDVWHTVELIHQLVDDPSRARLRYDLEPLEVDRMRLFIHETEAGAPGWSIPEIHVYEASHMPPESSVP